MQPLRSRLEDLARKARERLEGIYRARRSPRPEPQPTPDAEMTAPARPAENWELRSQAEIVDHIVQHYHAGLRRELPLLADAARQIERDHAGHAAAPVGLADLLESFAAELESHMLKEERVLFPMLRTGARGGQVGMPIRMMERDHEAHDAQLAELRKVAHDFAVPGDATPAWTQLYANLETLEADLHQHIYLENHVLFARAIGGED